MVSERKSRFYLEAVRSIPKNVHPSFLTTGLHFSIQIESQHSVHSPRTFDDPSNFSMSLHGMREEAQF
ncbi:hypothetical protein Pla110_11860 [Polystyrenella longa]|uniref:Uncharacterized protein n=1 Tax=Polystyrenella longa TaxID=2528007 RepID=A0A518CJS2_9PLAN|nr:hypothetical protein Pla110_11860 [Polystyrenella longa]